MQPSKGDLSFSEDAVIQSVCDDVSLFTISALDVKEALVKAGVGCGILYIKFNDDNERILCRFTMSGLKAAGEFCKIVNYYVRTKSVEIPEKVEQQVCEKCGRPLVEGIQECLFCYNKLSVIKRALFFLKPYKKKIIIAEVFLMVSSVLYLLVPLFNRYLIDNHLRPRVGTWEQVLLLVGGMLAARVVGEIIFIVNARIFNKATIQYANDLRVGAYEKVQLLSMNSLAKRTPGDLIRRIMEDTTTIRDFLTDGGRWAVEQIITFFIVIVILLFTDVKLTLLVFLPVPIVMFALSRFWKIIQIRYERQWRKNSKCQSILHDIIKGIRTVKAFGNEEIEIQKFSHATKELAQVSSDNEALWSRLFPLLTFFTGIGEFLVLYFGGKAIMQGELSLGVLVQFTMYIGYVYGPLRWLVSFPRWLADAMTSMVKVFEILDEEPDIAEVDVPTNTPISGGVRFEGVSFGYKSYEPVLKSIDLDIKQGEMIGIVGRSGVGKSTLINLVMRLYDPNMGSVYINDTNIRDMSPKHLHENIGVVFQDTFLFAGTIFDNIAYAKPGATLEEVIAAAKTANAHDFIMQTSDGYNTIIGESGHSISGGERQRLSIARAIIKNPDILILDEATSSLDVETEASIQDSLNRIIKGRTTIAIAHRLSTLRNADRLVVLDEGKVAEVGTHKELLMQKGIYYKLVMAQRQSSKLAEAGQA
ncbi:atp-binding cassette sub-family b [Holotrichia oblita]|nr:atp-binding cassette sub-family b [Holotrichia oblita]